MTAVTEQLSGAVAVSREYLPDRWLTRDELAGPVRRAIAHVTDDNSYAHGRSRSELWRDVYDLVFDYFDHKLGKTYNLLFVELNTVIHAAIDAAIANARLTEANGLVRRGVSHTQTRL